jgi:hypothetical protein
MVWGVQVSRIYIADIDQVCRRLFQGTVHNIFTWIYSVLLIASVKLLLLAVMIHGTVWM